MMNKQWISSLTGDIEAKYGKPMCEKMFGDTDKIKNDYDSLTAWFNNFIVAMDNLGESDYMKTLMASHCPCRYADAEEDIKKVYEESETLEEFVAQLDCNGIFQDNVELRGNVLYATKLTWSKSRELLGLCGHNHKGCYAESCHCFLASHINKPISNIFCHCCTVGYYSKMFRNALGFDVKVDFIGSVISGGEGCTAAIHLPAKT